MKRLFPVFAFLCVALLCAGSLSAQSVLNFPRVISSGDIFTGLAVGNPTVDPSTVTYTAYEADGSLVVGAGIENPVIETIPAGGQSARQYRELFGNVGFNGWVQASSATSGLTGFFLNANNTLSDLDGALATGAGTEFVVPFASQGAATVTELTVVNPNSEITSLTVVLYGASGEVIGETTLSLDARGLTRAPIGTLVPDTDLSGVTHLRVRADRPVVVHGVVADFQIPGSDFGR
jgi:hypothetical protein